jgi:formylglycine-generating enzyme required for sulfatase activity
MAPVNDAFCMDRYEAALEEWSDGSWEAASPYDTISGRTVRAVVSKGLTPQAYISGDQAASACEAAGKRLCLDSEWAQACGGPANTTWPYGNEYSAGACNDDYQGGHPVVDYFGTSDDVWDSDSMNDPGINQQPGTVALGGEFADCRSHWGIHDLHGNLHEWVDESSGVFRGGFYADGSFNGNGCAYVTTAHSRSYHDYSTGFRCCGDL